MDMPRTYDYLQRMEKAEAAGLTGKIVPPEQGGLLLHQIVKPGDRVVLEGDNQKQAAYLAQTLAACAPETIHDLHMLMSSISLPDHLAIFDNGIAATIDFAFSGGVAKELYERVMDQRIGIGSIHTYNELYSRYFTDRRPHVALVAAEQADHEGNLYTGANTEETALICEATRYAKGVVVAQVNRIQDRLSRIDIPGDQVDFVIPTGRHEVIEPLFTRDPARITPDQILMALLVIRGIYDEYGVASLNHGIGYATAAIELILPHYMERLNASRDICRYWALNPHPTMIPLIETGHIKAIHSFGSEPGMADYIAARKDVFFTGPDGVLKSNRPLCQLIGHYAVDCFVGSTLQIDAYGNSSTLIEGRIAGFGGAPNLGSDPLGRRYFSPACLQAGQESQDGKDNPCLRGRKLVVQVTPTVGGKNNTPVFVDELDAHKFYNNKTLAHPPVMIYGDDVTHIVTEKGIAYLLRCASVEERYAAIRAIAGETPVGKFERSADSDILRKKKIVVYPEDLGISRHEANRNLLTAKTISDLVQISGGRYAPPEQFLS